ncbi:RNA polymerase sigma factor [Asinibacterium sp. OR53]|uniref:RNA polymerase sigma factor n=1 Tax=Asinibacterium sp. OR53 TaxID=925409 RepID=UPI0004B7DFEC|nr:sigma-70 family RNA polymerase sigma factor [Asinibacterium sp. OR53]
MEGDQDMFLALYRKYYHSLLFIGLKEIKDAHLVKDAIQQQFLYLWEKRSSIQPAKNVKAYLVSSFLRKLTADWKRAEKTDNLQVAWNNMVEMPLPTPEESLIWKDEQQQLCRLLMDHVNALPARQKELIILRFYEGLSYEEIVQRTNLTHRTVYNKIHEALKKLKLELEPEKEKERFSFGFGMFLLCATLLVFYGWQ